MGDVFDDADGALAQIQEGFPGEPISRLAEEIRDLLNPPIYMNLQNRLPTQKEIQKELVERMDRMEKAQAKFAKQAAKIASREDPSYKTPIFKCLEDFEKCRKVSVDKNMCSPLYYLCIAKHLIPFVRHK